MRRPRRQLLNDEQYRLVNHLAWIYLMLTALVVPATWWANSEHTDPAWWRLPPIEQPASSQGGVP